MARKNRIANDPYHVIVWGPGGIGKACIRELLKRPENSPFPYKTGDMWRIEIEGKPVSMRCQFEAHASLKGDLEFHPGEQTSMAWYATAVPMIQAIPIVVGAEPGYIVPSVFANCVPDFRQLERRKSIVDTHHY